MPGTGVPSFAFFVKALITLLTVVEPLGLAPLVLGLTAGLTTAARARIVTRAVLIAAGIIAFFGVLGRVLLSALGITSAAFSIAGGALLFLVAIDMLFGRQSGARETPREEEEAQGREDISVFPLAIPLIAGPGTITTVILLVDQAGGVPINWALLVGATLLTLAVSWLSMRLSLVVQRVLGTTGVLVLARVEGLLLAALAVEFILDGVSRFLGQRGH
jgi:multiple antibiotic resistance protein